MTSKYFKLDISDLQKDDLMGPPTGRQKSPKRSGVLSEWGWGLGLVAFGKSDKAERREKIDKAVKELKK